MQRTSRLFPRVFGVWNAPWCPRISQPRIFPRATQVAEISRSEPRFSSGCWNRSRGISSRPTRGPVFQGAEAPLISNLFARRRRLEYLSLHFKSHCRASDGRAKESRGKRRMKVIRAKKVDAECRETEGSRGVEGGREGHSRVGKREKRMGGENEATCRSR